MSFDLGVVIPTLNRSLLVIDTIKQFENLVLENHFSIYIIIVESGDINDLELKLNGNKFKIEFELIFSPFKSSSFQRDLGLRRIKDCKFIIFIDDDIRFSSDSFLNLYNSFVALRSENQDVVGAAPLMKGIFLYRNSGLYSRLIYCILLWEYVKNKNDLGGRFFSPGINIAPSLAEYPYQVDWFMGGFMIYDYNKIVNQNFDPYFTGYSVFEDVDFSYRVNQNIGEIYIVPVIFDHLEEGYKDRDWKKITEMTLINRYYIAKKHFSKDKWLFGKFLLFVFLLEIVPFLYSIKHHYKHLSGTLSGLYKVLFKSKIIYA